MAAREHPRGTRIVAAVSLGSWALERFDAVVVGAGPAGSACAYRLARAGARVCLLDRARFPRDKPCGGGLTGRALRWLPFSVDPVGEDTVCRVVLRLRYGSAYERESSSRLILMTQRRRLDAFLADRAAGAGVAFRDGVKATAVEADERGATVSTPLGRLRAEVLIGADGANGITERRLGLDGKRVHGVALEGNVPHELVDASRFRGRAWIEVGTVPGGYGWVFPKADHVNVGVGGRQTEAPKLRWHLERLCRAHSIQSGAIADLRGFRLPMRKGAWRLSRGRTMLVGDAAGLVDPLSGDGIYEAFVSAALAAETAERLLAGAVESAAGYDAALERALSAHTRASWTAKQALDRFPGAVHAIARLPAVWRTVEALLGGELGHPGAARGPVRAPLRIIQALGSAGHHSIEGQG